MTASEGGAAPCPCCGGTGLVRPAAGETAGKSEVALLRGEILRLYGVIGSLEGFMASIYSVAGGAITDLPGRLKTAGAEIGAKNMAISSFEKEIAIRDSWSGRPSESRQYRESRNEFRRRSRICEAEGNGGDAAGIVRSCGGQPGSEGASKNDKPSGTDTFYADTCRLCGRTDLVLWCTVRKRMLEVYGSEVFCRMYVIHSMECPGCGAVTLPDTGAIPGTSFCPNFRSLVGSYRETGDCSEGRIVALLADIHHAHFPMGPSPTASPPWPDR